MATHIGCILKKQHNKIDFMELINAKSDIVNGFKRNKRGVDNINITKYGAYISKNFCRANRLKHNKFAHFINDGPDWKFFVNDDADGFMLVEENRETRRGGALRIFHAGLSHLFERSLNKKCPMSFRVSVTTMEHGGNKLFLIHTDKRLE